MGSTRHSSAGTPGGGDRSWNRGRNRGHPARRAGAFRVAAALLLLPGMAVPAHADAPARAAPSGIVVNAEVLNDLSRAAAAGPAAGERAAPALLPPPDRMPASRLLVQPLRPAEGEPPARPRRKPLAALGPADPAVQAPEATPAPAPAPAPIPDVTETPPAPPAPPPPSQAASPAPDPAPDPAADAGTEVAVAAPQPPVTPLPPEAPPAEVPAAATPLPPAAPPPPDPPPAARRQDPAATQSAALPPAGAALAPDRFLFAAGSAELSDRAKRDLETLAARLRAEADRRVQLLAYAGGETGDASRARRLSLSRALAVRAFLVEKGVATGRVDVRALGGKFKEGPADRVDVVEARR